MCLYKLLHICVFECMVNVRVIAVSIAPLKGAAIADLCLSWTWYLQHRHPITQRKLGAWTRLVVIGNLLLNLCEFQSDLI